MSSRSSHIAATAAAMLVALSGASLLISSTHAAASSPAPASPAPPVATPSPSYSPVIEPGNFVATVDNPWFPLLPGTKSMYKGTKDDKAAVDTVEVTHETAIIDGVTCVAVHDTLLLDGKLAEQTTDWYTQDLEGNVWYFGEDTKTLGADGAVISTEGSWKAGVDGAQPGIFMPADPQIGQSFLQEYLAGHAEDHFVITQIGVSVKVPFGSFDGAMLTVEWTPLEPDVLTEKTYVRGIGGVKELDVAGSNEKNQLVSVHKP